MLPFLIRSYSGALCTLSYLINTENMVVSLFRDEETEIQTDKLTCLKSTSNSLEPLIELWSDFN